MQKEIRTGKLGINPGGLINRYLPVVAARALKLV
jgi:hypothetical protein